MTEETHYETLFVSRHASTIIIQAAWRAQIKQVHTDKGDDSGRDALVNAAYSVLSDPAKRKDYDAWLDGQSASRLSSGKPDFDWGREDEPVTEDRFEEPIPHPPREAETSRPSPTRWQESGEDDDASSEPANPYLPTQKTRVVAWGLVVVLFLTAWGALLASAAAWRESLGLIAMAFVPWNAFAFFSGYMRVRTGSSIVFYVLFLLVGVFGTVSSFEGSLLMGFGTLAWFVFYIVAVELLRFASLRRGVKQRWQSS